MHNALERFVSQRIKFVRMQLPYACCSYLNTCHAREYNFLVLFEHFFLTKGAVSSGAKSGVRRRKKKRS